jgi:riboflavin transporter FmnP
MSFRKSVIIANVIVFSALAVMLTSLKAEVPFPLLPYLKFDFAEIPVMITLFLFGPVPSLATEAIHWIALTVTRGWILGPLMKFLAVVPMIAGFWLGVSMYKKLRSGKTDNVAILFVVGNIFGIVARVLVASIANIVVFLIVAPEWLGYAGYMLGLVGIVTTSVFEILLWALLLTGVFNTLHVPLSSFVAVTILRGAITRMPNLAEKMWILGKKRLTQ